MPGKRFQLKGPTMDAITRKAEELYGPSVKIIAAEKVRVGGWLGSTIYQAIVEIPVPADAPAVQPMTTQRRSVISELLDVANEKEAVIHGRPMPTVSTSSPVFESVLESLKANTSENEQLPDAAGGLPIMASQAGDLVILAGVGDTAVQAALEAASRFPGGALTATGGDIAGDGLTVDSPASAMAARAKGVLTGQPVILAYGLGSYLSARNHAPALKSFAADQTWLVVDVVRKHEDTSRWVEALSPALDVTALAVIGSRETETPRTARSLGIPVGWIDTAPGEYRAA